MHLFHNPFVSECVPCKIIFLPSYSKLSLLSRATIYYLPPPRTSFVSDSVPVIYLLTPQFAPPCNCFITPSECSMQNYFLAVLFNIIFAFASHNILSFRPPPRTSFVSDSVPVIYLRTPCNCFGAPYNICFYYVHAKFIISILYFAHKKRFE